MSRRMISILLSLLVLAGMLAVGAAGAGAEAYYDKAELLQIKSHIEKDAGMSKYATVQGACTDGRYAYFAVQEYSTVILKYDMSTWKLKKKATVTGLGHANDMTYNTKEDFIVVANNLSNNDKLTIVDPDTLETVRTVEVRRTKTAKEKKDDPSDKKDYKVLSVYSIAYQEAQNRYVVGLSGTYNFAVLDDKFKQIKQYKGVDTGNTRQGCDCDDDYIYFTQSGSGNAVVIYDYQGRHVDTVTLDHDHEVENLFHVDKDFYLTLHYYGNSLQRAGFSDDTQIRFKVNFAPGSGKGKMKPQQVHYGEDTKLSKCTFKKEGYFFAGWQVSRSYDGKAIGSVKGSDARAWLEKKQIYDYALYDDQATVSMLTPVGEVTLTAFWISEQYEIAFDSDEGEGYMEPMTVPYREKVALPDNSFIRHGYVFSGYTAYRGCDGRVYGYLPDDERPRWLEPQDAQRLFLFSEGDEVSTLTYDGTVTFTAQFSLAYYFDEEQHALLSYIGSDKMVDIPNPSGELYTIAEGAFRDNTIMTRMMVPASVDTVENGAIKNCPALEVIYFNRSFPERFGEECAVNSGEPLIYLVIEGQPLMVGFYGDRHCVPLLFRCAFLLENGAIPI